MNFSSGKRSGDLVAKHVVVLDLLTVDRDDDVPSLEACFLGGTAITNIAHQYSARVFQSECLGRVLLQILDTNAEHSAMDLSVFEQLLHNRLGHVRGNRESDSNIPTRWSTGKYLRVDTYKFGIEIHKSTAGISSIDRSIG